MYVCNSVCVPVCDHNRHRHRYTHPTATGATAWTPRRTRRRSTTTCRPAAPPTALPWCVSAVHPSIDRLTDRRRPHRHPIPIPYIYTHIYHTTQANAVGSKTNIFLPGVYAFDTLMVATRPYLAIGLIPSSFFPFSTPSCISPTQTPRPNTGGARGVHLR